MTQDSSVNTRDISLNEKKPEFFSKAMMHNFRQNIKENKKIFIVILVMHMLAMPMLLGAIIFQILKFGEPDDVDMYAAIAVGTTAIAGAMGILVPFLMMPYLHKRSVVDMRLSLPLTKTQRFVSDSLAGLFVYIVPFLISQVFTWILLLIGHLGFDGKTFVKDTIIDTATGAHATWYCDVFGKVMIPMLMLAAGGIVIMIMLYFLTVLVMSCCGTAFEGFLYSILANILIPGSVMIVVIGLFSSISTFVEEQQLNAVLPYTSPAGAIYGLFTSIEYYANGDNIGSWGTNIAFSKFIVGIIISTAVITVSAYLVNTRRKAEDTGKTVVFGIFFHIIMTLVLFCIGYLILINIDLSEAVIPMLIVTAVVYMLFTIVRNRGFARFGKAVIVYAVTMAAVICSYVVIDETDCFGAGSYVPKEYEVSEIKLSYADFFNERHLGPRATIVVKDRENIKLIIETNKQILEDMDNDVVPCTDGYVQYTLRSGRNVVRYLSVGVLPYAKICEIDCTDEVKKQRAEHMAKEIMDVKKSNAGRMAYDKTFSETITVYSNWTAWNKGKLVGQGESKHISELPGDFYESLAECLKEDILSETEEEYFRPWGNMWEFSLAGYNVTIRESYTKTLDYLSSCGFGTLPVVDEELADAILASDMDIYISSPEMRKALGCVTGITAARKDGSNFYEGRFRLDITDGINDYTTFGVENELAKISNMDGITAEFTEILANSHKEYKTDEDCYTITVNGNHAVISSQCNETAEKLYIKAATEYLLKEFQRVMSDENNRDIELTCHFLNTFLEVYGKGRIDSAAGEGAYDALSEANVLLEAEAEAWLKDLL